MQMKCPKQYLHIHSKTVLEITLNKILQIQNIKSIVVAIDPSDAFFSLLPIAKHPRVRACLGGQERSDSVFQALLALKEQLEASDDDWVLVHDAARPCVSVEKIEQLIETVFKNNTGGILAHPVADTLKQVNAITIDKTVDRSVLWQAHTPQMFRIGHLQEALEKAKQNNYVVTDESSAIEYIGKKSLVVADRRDNIKITYPEDLFLAEKILSSKF